MKAGGDRAITVELKNRQRSMIWKKLNEKSQVKENGQDCFVC